jgi:predicted PurR-regulated permease PerM
MPNQAENRAERTHFLFMLGTAVAVTALFYSMVSGFVVGLFLAAVFAGLAYGMNEKVIAKVGGRRSLGSLLTLLLLIVVVLIPGVLMTGVAVGEAAHISQAVVPWVEGIVDDPHGFRARLEKYPIFEHLAPYEETIRVKLGSIASKAANFLVSSLAAGTAGTAKFFLQVFVALYAMFYFLTSGRELLLGLDRFIPLNSDEKRRMLTTLTTVTRATLKGTIVIGLIQGGLAGGAMALCGIEGTLFWSAVMVVLSVIPGIGTGLVWGPAVVYLALAGQTGAALGLLLFCVIVVGTVDNVLRPILVGKDTEMPDLLVLLGTLGGLGMFGASGIIIGPVIAAMFLTVWKLYGNMMEERASLLDEEPAELPPAAGEA